MDAARAFLALALAPEAEQRAWAASSPLRACLPGKAFAKLLPVAPNRVGIPFRPLRIHFNGETRHLSLPADIDYRALSLDQGAWIDLTFDTDQGQIVSNYDELFRAGFFKLPAAKQLGAFLALENAPPKCHAPRPGFPTRLSFARLGRADVGPHGYIQVTEFDLPPTAFNADPLRVTMDLLSPDQVAEVDAAVQGFLDHADRLHAETTPHLLASMKDFVEGVYRDIDDDPIPKGDPHRIEAIEQMLADGPDRIWDHVSLEVANVSPLHASTAERLGLPNRPIYLELSGDCAWEIEHGLGLSFRAGVELRGIGHAMIEHEYYPFP